MDTEGGGRKAADPGKLQVQGTSQDANLDLSYFKCQAKFLFPAMEVHSLPGVTTNSGWGLGNTDSTDQVTEQIVIHSFIHLILTECLL